MDPIDVAELALSLPEIDPEKPSPARIYDFWLGGSQNFASDREVGQRAIDALPGLQAGVRANRAFLGRVVHHLAERGVTQFLDLGSGVPTIGNVHEAARYVNPSARVVYVDIDPVAIAHARALLATVDKVEAILADLRRPETVFAHPLVRETLDLTAPIAFLMNAVMHFIPDAEHPEQIVRAYIDRAAPGSYVAISHGTENPRQRREVEELVNDYQRSTGVPLITRGAEQISPWLTGLDIQPPGIVTIDQWHPDTEEPYFVPLFGVLARKPDTDPSTA
ncbi:SAM-dependent methyltransferase [Actinospica robiniae]|uniref:SAM-dependent methyltransferase n=1 Tax=Actinospica robiniae TaxID=304901 RepID=UPI0003FA76AE|nr:SAM-dependent methyltransferase [Actinospica robiniae]